MYKNIGKRVSTALVLITGMVLLSCTACAESLVIDDQPSADPGSSISFTVSVHDAPNAVAAFGFKVIFDPNVLDYVTYERGDLVGGFALFDISNADVPDILTIGGIEPESAKNIVAGSSGIIAILTFEIRKAWVESNLSVIGLADDMAGWTTSDGKLLVPPSLALNNQVSGSSGTLVSFDLLKNQAPNDVEAFGLTIHFDQDTLGFVEYEKGALITNNKFMFLLNPNDADEGILIMAGAGIPIDLNNNYKILQSETGTLLTLTFSVRNPCTESDLRISDCTDDIKDWTIGDGKLMKPLVCPGEKLENGTCFINAIY